MYWHHMKNRNHTIDRKKIIETNSVVSRRLAALCVKEVMDNNLPLQQVISSQKDYATLESRDRAFVRLIVATTFRRMGQINSVLKPFLRQTPPKFIYAALQTATAQIIYLEHLRMLR
jgi:16S rRNA (cytosine967-C5)-methyltransferase